MRVPADLLKLAKQMRARAYAPYSRFKVGAAVRAKSGRIYGGCNVENAAYPVGSCAEANAIAAMAAGGDREIAEILVIGGGKSLITPCGACRQRLREFAGEKAKVHLCRLDGSGRTMTLAKLLPLSFGPESLDKKG
jgi:cytidine deaminase